MVGDGGGSGWKVAAVAIRGEKKRRRCDPWGEEEAAAAYPSEEAAAAVCLLLLSFDRASLDYTECRRSNRLEACQPTRTHNATVNSRATSAHLAGATTRPYIPGSLELLQDIKFHSSTSTTIY
jgi:hypothetical protein